MCVRAKSLQLCTTLCNPMDVTRQAPLSVGFSRQEYWSRLPFLSPRHLPDPGIEPVSLMSPATAGEFFTTTAIWEILCLVHDRSKQHKCVTNFKIKIITPKSKIFMEGVSFNEMDRVLTLFFFSIYFEFPQGEITD